MKTYQVVRVVVKTNCDLERQIISPLFISKSWADVMKGRLERLGERKTFETGCKVSYLVETC